MSIERGSLKIGLAHGRTRRVKRMEEAGKSKPLFITVCYDSFDVLVEQAALPGVASGALEPGDMADVVAARRGWETPYGNGPLSRPV